MRCSQVERHIEAFVDGALAPDLASAVAAHAGSCRRCTARLQSAERLARALASTPLLRAPRGFTDQVMNAVYKEALRGGAARAAAPDPAASRQGAPARMYRRLGLSFVVTAGVLAVTLLIPGLAYNTLVGAGDSSAGLGGAQIARDALNGADVVARGALGEQIIGGGGQ
jgi:anti-sigma factor RsiW